MFAQEVPPEGGELISGEGSFDFRTHVSIFTNNVIIKYRGAVLTADRAQVNEETGEVVADSNVRIQQDNQVWSGDHILYNFKTHEISAEKFRTGRAPGFAEGRGLSGSMTNHVYDATNAVITADDYADPTFKLRAKHIRIIPGKKIEATHATLYVGGVPVFYFPYYERNLGNRVNNLNVTPGYRSSFGPFLLGTYEWFASEQIDGAVRLDYREERGVGGGTDLSLHLNRWGEVKLSYYYAHDEDPSTNAVLNAPVFEDRHKAMVSYDASPVTNFTAKVLAQYQSDIGIAHDFFEGEYRKNPQPDTFVELNKFWSNFSLNTLVQPRINDFYETVERLPDVRLTGFRQQLASTPLYYESESSLGYYRRLFPETNSAPTDINFEAARADTFQQIILPETLFGWLNVTPRVGGRFTYYSHATGPGATTDEEYRGVFNTGAEVSLKASRLWPEVESKVLELDGLRHIVEPSVNYVYIPEPNARPNELPQFDYQLTSLRMLPIEFPQYNSIDSIDSQNVVRLGLRNKLQTKREGKVEDVIYWEAFNDWRLDPRTDQTKFSDVYSDLILQPRSWMTLQSIIRVDVDDENFRLALHTLTLQPNNSWSWSIGHYYTREDLSGAPEALGPGNDLLMSSLFYRMNENWGFRAQIHYDITRSRLQEQYYTIYRDMRSWTAALSAGLRDNGSSGDEFLIAFTFSLKAMPRFDLGSDMVRPYSLLGR